MACNCIRGVYDCSVIAVDKDTILYQDLSDWMDEDGYEIPASYDLGIQRPGTKKIIYNTVYLNAVNKFNGANIGAVADGLYCFSVESCGVKYAKNKAIFPRLECCIRQAWATLGLDHEDKIREVESHTKLASINAEMNNVKSAKKNLEIAEKLMENLKCDCNC